MKYCIIMDDVVTDVYDQAPQVHPSMEVVQVTDDNVQPGWVRDDQNNIVPPPPEVLTQDQLIAYAPIARRGVENSDITVAGINMPLATMIQYRMALTVDQANKNPGQIFEWKAGDTYYQLTAVQIQNMSAALANFLDACMVKEKEIANEIIAGTITTRDQIDAEFQTVPRTYS